MSTVLVYTPGRRAVDNPRSAGQMRLACVVRRAPQIPGRCIRRWPLGPAWNRRQVVTATARRKSMVAARRVLRSTARGVRAPPMPQDSRCTPWQSASELRQPQHARPWVARRGKALVAALPALRHTDVSRLLPGAFSLATQTPLEYIRLSEFLPHKALEQRRIADRRWEAKTRIETLTPCGKSYEQRKPGQRSLQSPQKSPRIRRGAYGKAFTPSGDD